MLPRQLPAALTGRAEVGSHRTRRLWRHPSPGSPSSRLRRAQRCAAVPPAARPPFRSPVTVPGPHCAAAPSCGPSTVVISCASSSASAPPNQRRPCKYIHASGGLRRRADWERNPRTAVAGREGPRRAAGPVPSAQLQPPGGQSLLVRCWPCLNGLEEWRLSCNVSGGPGTLFQNGGAAVRELSHQRWWRPPSPAML